MSHHWSILPTHVEAKIITAEQAGSLVMAHQEVHRRMVQEILFTLPELVEQGLMQPEAIQKVHTIVKRYQAQGLPDF